MNEKSLFKCIKLNQVLLLMTLLCLAKSIRSSSCVQLLIHCNPLQTKTEMKSPTKHMCFVTCNYLLRSTRSRQVLLLLSVHSVSRLRRSCMVFIFRHLTMHCKPFIMLDITWDMTLVLTPHCNINHQNLLINITSLEIFEGNTILTRPYPTYTLQSALHT